jgi:hypothetical protein
MRRCRRPRQPFSTRLRTSWVPRPSTVLVLRSDRQRRPISGGSMRGCAPRKVSPTVREGSSNASQRARFWFAPHDSLAGRWGASARPPHGTGDPPVRPCNDCDGLIDCEAPRRGYRLSVILQAAGPNAATMALNQGSTFGKRRIDRGLDFAQERRRSGHCSMLDSSTLSTGSVPGFPCRSVPRAIATPR